VIAAVRSRQTSEAHPAARREPSGAAPLFERPGVNSPDTVGASAEIDACLDAAPIGRGQLRVATLCAVVAMFDGFDTQAIAFVAPVLGESWHIGPERFGIIFAAGLIGIMTGQLTLGALADRFGRRPIILWCTLLFALGSLTTTVASNWTELLALRFLTGIGLGGATPNLIALTAECAPPRARSTMITAMFAGFPLGAAVGAYFSSLLIPAFGWQSVFLCGGLLPLTLLAVLAASLPESPHYLATATGRSSQLQRLLAELAPASSGEGRLPSIERPPLRTALPRTPVNPFVALFAQGRAPTTALLWVAYFNSLLMIYFLMSWLPSVVRNSGLALDTAIISSVFLNLGGALGGVLLGKLADRLGAFRVLTAGYAAAGIALVLIGLAGQATGLLMGLVFVAGLCTIGGQTAMNAAATSLYPATMRATALGTALAVGRTGSIVGPTVGGLLLASRLPLYAVFCTVAAPAFVTCATAAALDRLARRDRAPTR